MKMTKRILFGFSAAAVLFIGLKLVQPNPNSVSNFKNINLTVQYVGNEECAACHEDIYNSFIRTGMGRSFYTPAGAKVIEDFASNEHVYDPNMNFYYTASMENGVIIQTEYRLNNQGEKIHELNRKADYIIGSGNHNRTYLTEQNGFVKEMPLTWYTDKNRWDLSPGYHSSNMRFSRLIVEECMHCHNSFTDFIPFAQNKYSTPLPQGIGCERCHGPGQLHVQMRIANKQKPKSNIDYTIVNPKHLPFQEQLDVCQQCHLQGEISVFKQGKHSTDFRPGMALSNVKSIFMDKTLNTGEFRIASHADRLAQSACFKESTSLTCITCHNPHVPVQEHTRQSFNNRCLSCHEFQALSPANDKEYHSASADCIQCHMIQGGTTDIPHVNFTDHKIQINKSALKDPPPALEHSYKKPLELVNYFLEEGADAEVQKGIAYIRYYESRHEHEVYLKRAIVLLENNLAVQKNHTDGWYYLGRAYHLLGMNAKAEDAYGQVLEFNPAHFPGLAQAGALALEKGNYRQALSIYNRALIIYGDDPVIWNNIGRAYFLADSMESAVKAYSQAIALAPDYANAYNNNGELLLYTYKDTQHSKDDFLSCLALNPDHVYALHNMSNIFIMEEDWEQAISFARETLAKNSEFVAAYGTLATAFQRLGRMDEARTALLRILKFEPNNIDARKILESLSY